MSEGTSDEPGKVTVGEIIRIVQKLRAEGGDALTPDEWNALEFSRTQMPSFVEWFARTKSLREQPMGEALALYKRLSPADQLRFEHWTPEELLAFGSLLDIDDASLDPDPRDE